MTWFWIFLAVLLFWLLQNCIHEGAHALVAKHYGATILKFWPFPSRRFNGRFTFAYMQYRGVLEKKHVGRIAIAPIWANMVLVPVATVLHLAIHNYWVWVVAMALITTNTVDAINNFRKGVFARDEDLDSPIADVLVWAKNFEERPEMLNRQSILWTGYFVIVLAFNLAIGFDRFL